MKVFPERAGCISGATGVDENLRERAYERLRRRLFTGDFAPGQMVSLSRLAELSETPLAATREALQRLEYDGMVRIFPKRGIQIAEMNVEYVREAFLLRMILEKEGARKLAEIGRDEVFAEMEAMTLADLEVVKEEVSERTMKRVSKTNQLFHANFIRILNSRDIEQLYERNRRKIEFINRNVNLPPGGEFAPSMHEHLDIIRMLRARDPDGAARALELHINAALRRVMSL